MNDKHQTNCVVFAELVASERLFCCLDKVKGNIPKNVSHMNPKSPSIKSCRYISILLFSAGIKRFLLLFHRFYLYQSPTWVDWSQLTCQHRNQQQQPGEMAITTGENNKLHFDCHRHISISSTWELPWEPKRFITPLLKVNNLSFHYVILAVKELLYLESCKQV